MKDEWDYDSGESRERMPQAAYDCKERTIHSSGLLFRRAFIKSMLKSCCVFLIFLSYMPVFNFRFCI